MTEPFGPLYERPTPEPCPHCPCCTRLLCEAGAASALGCLGRASTNDPDLRAAIAECPCDRAPGTLRMVIKERLEGVTDRDERARIIDMAMAEARERVERSKHARMVLATIRAAVEYLRTAPYATVRRQLLDARLHPHWQRNPLALADHLAKADPLAGSPMFFGNWKGAQNVLLAAGLPWHPDCYRDETPMVEYVNNRGWVQTEPADRFVTGDMP